MIENQNNAILDARASRAGFIVFGVLYAPLCILYLVLLLTGKLRGQSLVVLVPWLLLMSTYAWLLGFRIKITEKEVAYRDGLWRWQVCSRDTITKVENCWLEYRNLGKVIKIPRLAIHCKGTSPNMIAINPKPFSRDDLKRLREILSLGCG